MLDPELLKRLAKINQTGSFSKAADCLFVSRQALMSQIRVLEKQLGFSLFKRTNHGTTLTVAGRMYLNNSLRMVHSYNAMIRRCHEAASGIHSIRIGSLPNLPGSTLPKICYEYHKLYPNVKLHFLDYPLEDYFSSFKEHSFDIMTENMMNYYHTVDDLCFLPLQKVKQHIGIAQSNPLSKKKSLTYADLRGRTLFMYKQGIGKSEDLLRLYLNKYEPDIKIVDINSYDSSLMTKCLLENAVVLLYTTQSYPGLISIPADWDITIELGIGYRHNPSPEVADFLSLTEKMNRQMDLIG